jgi:hypothetical protein
MININKLCIGCYTIYPLFNNPGMPRKYCNACKKEEIVNVKDKLCEICNVTQACFNKPGLPRKYCVYCKDDDMVDIKNKNKKCIKCHGPQANYNKPGLKAEYCVGCKDNDMINVNVILCQKCNMVQPVYNKPGLPARFCVTCKTDEMIDVNAKLCIDCGKPYPYFNLKGLPPRYCENCKTNEMIDVKNPRCVNCDKLYPTYNKPGLPKRYCSDCKTNDMVDVTVKRCIECKEIRISRNNKYDGHCLRCFIYKFPDNKITKNYKVKERYIQDFIKEEFCNEFDFDKIIQGGCSKKRPDAFKDCLTYVLIIEIDEYQHRNYEEICENRRMMEIFGDTNYRPVVFIRFNPDSYIDKNNDKMESSFNMHKSFDVPIIRDNIEWQNRLNKLKQTIKHYIKNIPEKAVIIEKLFYDYN